MRPRTVPGGFRRHLARRAPLALVVLFIGGVAGCGSSRPAEPSRPLVAPSTVAPDLGVAVAFDSPGTDPRPLREVSVPIAVPTNVLRMRVTDLTYRGVVCGFTLSGTRPNSPLTIAVRGTIASGSFASGPARVVWTADGIVSAEAPLSNNGWSFSADAYPSRNGPGWAVSIGAVTAEGDNVIPSAVTCELRSAGGFGPVNGPVGYWAGFATR